MDVKKKFLIPFLLSFLFSASALAGIVDSGALTEASYWTSHNPEGDRVILDETGVREFNRKIYNAGLDVTDMKTLPASIPVREFLPWISNTWAMKGTVYRKGKELTEEEKEQIRENVSLGTLPPEGGFVPLRYGVTVRHAMIRNLPLADGIFESADDVYYDNVQDSVLEAGEPVAILHESRDEKYYFVRLYNLFGWIAREDVALCSRAQFERYADPENFLVVTGRDYLARTSGENVFHLMGARLLLLQEKKDRWQVALPYKDDKTGQLREKNVWLNKGADLHRGYLPYTSNQVIRQAFKFLGSVYGWGGAMQSVDCSSLVGSVYSTMGIWLPRNTTRLKRMPGQVTGFEGLDTPERLRLFAKLQPGSAVSLAGHIMLYLGMEDGAPYVIHSSSSYYVKDRKIYVRRVLVSDLELHRKSGLTFLDSVINVITYQ